VLIIASVISYSSLTEHLLSFAEHLLSLAEQLLFLLNRSCTLRGQLEVMFPADGGISIEEVEPAANIVKRFATGPSIRERPFIAIQLLSVLSQFCYCVIDLIFIPCWGYLYIFILKVVHLCLPYLDPKFFVMNPDLDATFLRIAKIGYRINLEKQKF
jgi:hypothetical protein